MTDWRMTEPQKAAEVKRTLEERAREWNQSEEGQYAFAEARSRTGHLSSMYPWLPIVLADFAREVLEEAARVAQDEVGPDQQRYYLKLSDGSRVRGDDLLAFNTAVCDVGDKVAARIRQMKEGW